MEDLEGSLTEIHQLERLRHELVTLALSGQVGYIVGGDAEPEDRAEWEMGSFVDYVLSQEDGSVHMRLYTTPTSDSEPA